MDVISQSESSQKPGIIQHLLKIIKRDGVLIALKKVLIKAFVLIGEMIRRIPFSYFTVVAGMHRRRTYLSKMLHKELGGVVRYGPFKGLNLGDEFNWGKADVGSMLFGFYEKELLDALAALPSTHKTFINLGGADGYYAVGVLVNNMFSHVYCYELSEVGRKNIKACAQRNNVSHRLSIRGMAKVDFYSTLKAENVDLSKCVLLCDIEGGEFDVFNEKTFEALKGAFIFIEVHEWHENGFVKFQKLKDMASKFFNVTQGHTTARDLSKFPELSRFHDSDRWLVCSEGRGRLMIWLKLEPKQAVLGNGG